MSIILTMPLIMLQTRRLRGNEKLVPMPVVA